VVSHALVVLFAMLADCQVAGASCARMELVGCRSVVQEKPCRFVESVVIMHPAYSVIVFTTASGAGYGWLVWLAFGALIDGLAAHRSLGLVGLALALSLICIGLLSSTLHLGRPARAWRAMSQWRTSWLSREGVLAIATFFPAGCLGLLWVFFDGEPRAMLVLAACAVIVLAGATVWSTAMIYQSLPTIRAWHTPIVSPTYLVLALASGAVLNYALMTGFFGAGSRALAGRRHSEA
jgi:sulfite dehydrogenase (quinone) subunit SoeC